MQRWSPPSARYSSVLPELGSARRVWLWFHTEGLNFPLRFNPTDEIRWTLHLHREPHILTNPVYAGAYCYGKSRRERCVDDQGQSKKRIRLLPQSEWAVRIPSITPGISTGPLTRPIKHVWTAIPDLSPPGGRRST